MITFTRAQIASLIATGIDFGLTIFGVSVMGWPRVAAGATGTFCGGVAHFLLSRVWVFRAQEQKWSRQVHRYLWVWVGNFGLNVSLFYLLQHYMNVNYVIAKVVVAVAIAVFYNYTLQKRFVFK
jgi:putative flippase GtrA